MLQLNKSILETVIPSGASMRRLVVSSGFLFFPSLEVFAFAFAFVLVCQIHLGLLYALMVSRFGSVPVGARW